MNGLSFIRRRLKDRPDSEHEQALLRIGIVGCLLAYMALFHGAPESWTPTQTATVYGVAIFFSIGLVLFVAICAFPGVNVPRRLVAMLVDSCSATWYMWIADEYGVAMVGVYLFITFGNGFRYGRRYLFGCQALCLLGFLLVLATSSYWALHRAAGVGLLLALVILPLYVSTLLKRIQEARAKAEEANNAKTTFLANMSHEMRTPLNGIVGAVDLIRATELTDQQGELIKLLKHSISVLRSLVDDVLDISKIEAGRLTVEVASFDLHATINALVQLLRPHAKGKGLNLHASIDPQLDYQLRGDSHHLRQVLLNLVGNAIKFTEKGEVALCARLLGESPEGVTVRFEVRDTGIGISDTALPKIFERFVQADQSTTRKYGGTGLGTTIAKQLVELMGGTIGAESKLGEGSVFWFELPLLRDAVPVEPLANAKTDDDCVTLLVADAAASDRFAARLRAVPENVQTADPSSFAFALDRVKSDGKTLRALVAACAVDDACSAFAAVRQRFGERAVALIHIAQEPLSVVDSARLNSIPGACTLGANASSRIIANAIHAAIAGNEEEAHDGDRLQKALESKRDALTILVAEDNTTNQAIISQLLKTAGHSVLLASDGEEALDVYETENPDLAILDFNMPQRTGVEVIKAIRAMELAESHTPAIILSASVTPEAMQIARLAGADDFIGKPFDAALLLERIDELARNRSAKRPPKHQQPQLRTLVTPRLAVHIDGDLVSADRLRQLEDIARDSGFLLELLRGFRSDVDGLLARIDASIVGNKAEDLADLLHTLKGAAVGIGATRLAALSKDMEALPLETESAARKRKAAELRTAYRATLDVLERYMRTEYGIAL
ncbi:MAG TPA: ATP-binding protein [Casimicrobiaceae bacterium]|jgi:two-component system sensor histidine kinase RpfC